MLQQNTIKDAIKEYLTAYKQAGYSNHTVEKYGVHLENLAIWLAERDITQLEQLNKAILREWGASLHDIESPRTKKGWAPATIKQAVCSVRSFLTWCLEDDLIDYALANALKIPKVEETMQRTLDIKEAQQIINSYDDGTVMGIRNCALFSLMIDSGLRSAEVCRVQVADLQFGIRVFNSMSNQIEILNLATVLRKGNKEKPVYSGPETVERLKVWLEIRPQVAKAETTELFVSLGGTKPGTHLTKDGLRVIMRNVAEKTGIDHFSPHALRRSFACFLDAAGASSRKIQLFGGWSSIREVETYTRSLQTGSQYAQYSPTSFLKKINELANESEE